jgi:hypothetical protein
MKLGDTLRKRWRLLAPLVVGLLLGTLLVAPPASAHFQASISHIAKHMKNIFYTKSQSDNRYLRPLYGNFNGDDATLVKGRGILSSERMGTGFYVVQFRRNISTCVVMSSIASIDNVNPESATIGTGVWDSDAVFVLIRRDFADTREDADFSVAAIC